MKKAIIAVAEGSVFCGVALVAIGSAVISSVALVVAGCSLVGVSLFSVVAYFIWNEDHNIVNQHLPQPQQ